MQGSRSHLSHSSRPGKHEADILAAPTRMPNRRDVRSFLEASPASSMSSATTSS